MNLDEFIDQEVAYQEYTDWQKDQSRKEKYGLHRHNPSGGNRVHQGKGKNK